MRRIGLLLIIVVGTPLIAQTWDKEPKDFRAVPFGTSKAEAGRILNLPAHRCTKNFDDRACYAPNFIGDVKTEEVYEFDGDRLVNVIVSFDTNQYQQLRDIFVEKFGPPTSTKNEPVKTRTGAEFTNEELAWKGTKVCVTMRKFSGNIVQDMATLTDCEWNAGRERNGSWTKRRKQPDRSSGSPSLIFSRSSTPSSGGVRGLRT